MKYLLIISAITLSSSFSLAWGPTGHRTVAEIAQRHLRPDVAVRVKQTLNGYILSDVANWADDRSLPVVLPFLPLHYVNVMPEFKSYQEEPANKNGDVFVAIMALINFLRTNNGADLATVPALAHIDRVTALKLLVHFVGDVHQPLHVIEGRDKSGQKLNGGNRFQVNWMGKWNSNLHSIWDDEMIDFERFSYSEYASFLDHASTADIDAWSQTSVVDWVNEGLSYRNQIFTFPDAQTFGSDVEPGIGAPVFISYNYIQTQRATFRKRILQAGIRLAHLLNMLM